MGNVESCDKQVQSANLPWSITMWTSRYLIMPNAHRMLFSWAITVLIVATILPAAFSFRIVSNSANMQPKRQTQLSAAAHYANVQAVIFDVDGTLADSGQLGFDATLVVLEKNGIAPITYAEYCDHTRYTTPDRLARHAGFTPEEHPEKFAIEGKRLGQEFDDLYINLVSMETAAFYPGMLEVVRNIPQENVGLGALTNAAGRYAHAVLKVNNEDFNDADFDLCKRFGSILGADDVVKPKPYADGLLQVCKELGVEPTQCVYIGDSPSDGQAAKAAGMPGIGVTWGAHEETKLASHFTHMCRSVDELMSLLPQEVKCT